MMLRARVGFWTRLKLHRTRNFCTRSNNGENKGEKIESSISHYNETYKKLDNLDFMTAAKILFETPPKKKKFGFDFHLVQFFFACLPSLAVYLVAQYARRKMKMMDAELEEKKKNEEEEKATEEAEQKALEEQKKAESQKELVEVRARLGKLEETVKEIVVESKKHPANSQIKTQEDQSAKSQPAERSKDKSELSKEKPNNQQSVEQNPGLDQVKVSSRAPVSDDQKGKKRNGRAQEDS